MKFWTLVVLTVFSLSTQVFALQGGNSGGGGDLCEDRIKIVRDDLKAWIIQGGPNGLQLPSRISTRQYSESMLLQINKAKIRCVGAGDRGFPVTVNETPKVCRFDRDNQGSRITCDFAKFNLTKNSDQYVLIHHEYAGLSGVEIPVGGDSDYRVSNQISGYLVDELVKKLAVNPQAYKNSSEGEDCYQAPSGNAETGLLEDVRNLRVSCIKNLLSEHWFQQTGHIEARDSEGKTALHIVAASTPSDKIKKMKALEIAELLLAAHAKTETRDIYDNTPILSASSGNPEMVMLLASRGGNIKATNNGNCVLHESRDDRVIDLYIKAHGDLNQNDEVGRPPVAVWTNALVNQEMSNRHQQGYNFDLSIPEHTISKLVGAGANINGGKFTAMQELKRLAGTYGIEPNQLDAYYFLKKLGARD